MCTRAKNPSLIDLALAIILSLYTVLDLTLEELLLSVGNVIPVHVPSLGTRLNCVCLLPHNCLQHNF